MMNTDDDVTQPIIRAPSQFGVCLDAVTKKEARCVLSAESCETDEQKKGGEVYSPPYERQHTNFLSSSLSLSCIFPHDVSIGRCTSSLDDKRCSPSSDSCGTKSVFYNITDPTDTNKSHGMKNSGMSTTFPACYNSETKLWQCVLDQQDCLTIDGGSSSSSEQFKYAKWTAEWADQPCHCEDIPTGVCYVDPRSPNNNTIINNNNNNNNNTTPAVAMTTTTSSLMLVLTPLNSFCAVTSRDCPKTTHQWMSARDFLEISKISAEDRRSSGSSSSSSSSKSGSVTATFQCRLCNEASIKKEKQQQPYRPPNSYVAAPGACQDTKTLSFIGCAMESTDCEDADLVLPNNTSTTTTTTNTLFVSSQQLYQQGLVCPIEQTYNWGECTSTGDTIECTNQAESCYYDFRFKKSQPPPNNHYCTMYHNTKTMMPTYFSYCSPRIDNDHRDWKEIRCVWDQSECDTSTERWEEAKIPNNAWFPGCLCEDVLTGVCKEEKEEHEQSTTNTDADGYYYYCAVSAKGCTHPSSYIPQRLLANNNINSTSCPLCLPSSSRRSPPPSPPPPPLSPSPSTVAESLSPSSFSPSSPPISDSSITTTTISPLLPFPPSNNDNDNMKEQMITNEYYNSDIFDDGISSSYGYGYSSDNNNDIVLSQGTITGIVIAVVVVVVVLIITIIKSSSTTTTTNSTPSAVAERGHQQDEENNTTTTNTNTASLQPPQVPLPLPLPPPNHDEELIMPPSSATIT